jgi:hypothetical protein
MIETSGSLYLSVGRFLLCTISGAKKIGCSGTTNQFGELGRDPNTAGAPTFTLSNPKQVAAGDTHACAVNVAGETFCWGEGYGHQPVKINLPFAVQIDAGAKLTCAALIDGTVACWPLGGAPELVQTSGS